MFPIIATDPSRPALKPITLDFAEWRRLALASGQHDESYVSAIRIELETVGKATIKYVAGTLLLTANKE